MNSVLKALNFRHACKSFNRGKKIPKADLDIILEAAWISPSSFGIEAWKFLVLESEEIRQKLRPVCWNQPQITDSSHVIVILAQPELVFPDTLYIRENFERRDLPKAAVDTYLEKYKNHMETEVFPVMSAYSWCSKQCYIALANIMSSAAAQGIDSCPIEGFEKHKAEKILKIDTKKYEIAVLVALGYRLKEQTKRHRHPMETKIEFL
jgi:nitroreductase